MPASATLSVLAATLQSVKVKPLLSLSVSAKDRFTAKCGVSSSVPKNTGSVSCSGRCGSAHQCNAPVSKVATLSLLKGKYLAASEAAQAVMVGSSRRKC